MCCHERSMARRHPLLLAIPMVACGVSIGPPSNPPLEVAGADPAVGFQAFANVDGERIHIEATPVSEEMEGSVSPTTTVTGADGTVYATWTTDPATGEPSGTIGGQSFGRPEDRATDRDPAVWGPIVNSRVGAVLDEVSGQAEATLTSGQYLDVEEVLQDVDSMGPLLHALADPEAETECGDGVCSEDEDDRECPEDCGCAAPSSCGGVAPFGCYCDPECMANGDCCADACDACSVDGCPMCGETELACGTACVPEERLCDGIDDCPMREDEGCDDFDEPDPDDEDVAAGMTLDPAPEDEEDFSSTTRSLSRSQAFPVSVAQCNIYYGGSHTFNLDKYGWGKPTGPATYKTARRFATLVAKHWSRVSIIGMQEVTSRANAGKLAGYLEQKTGHDWDYVYHGGNAVFWRRAMWSLKKDLGTHVIEYYPKSDGHIVSLRVVAAILHRRGSHAYVAASSGKLIPKGHLSNRFRGREALSWISWISRSMGSYSDSSRLIFVDQNAGLRTSPWYRFNTRYFENGGRKRTHMWGRFDYVWWDYAAGDRRTDGFRGGPYVSRSFGSDHRSVAARVMLER
jgi:hypothetical protein